MTEVSKKTCPIMSRPSPQTASGSTNFNNVFSNTAPLGKSYHLMEIKCLESECQLWKDACKDRDCNECMMHPETDEERNNCPGKTGRCMLVG
jgi:hypothetical protein